MSPLSSAREVTLSITSGLQATCNQRLTPFSPANVEHSHITYRIVITISNKTIWSENCIGLFSISKKEPFSKIQISQLCSETRLLCTITQSILQYSTVISFSEPLKHDRHKTSGGMSIYSSFSQGSELHLFCACCLSTWLGRPMAALQCTSGFVDDVVFSHNDPVAHHV